MIRNARRLQNNVFKGAKQKVEPLAARSVQFICINVLYQISGTAFARWYEELKKTLKLKLGKTVAVQKNVLKPLKEKWSVFFSTAQPPADMLAEAHAAFHAKQQLD